MTIEPRNQTGEGATSSPRRGPRSARLTTAVVAIVVAGLTAFGVGWGSGGGSDTGSSGGETEDVTVISNLWIGIAPFVLAHDQGFDADHGVNLDVKFVEELKDVTSALGSGRADAGYSVGPGQALTLL